MGEVQRRGLMFVLSSPSGAGKTTIARRILESDNNLTLSISVTTRPKRPSEVEGRDYLFIDKKRYDRMVKKGELLEHAEVFDNHYGTPREPVEEALVAGRDVLFDIDWQGAEQLRAAMPGDVVSVFILPPSREELEARLHRRAEDPEDVVKARMAKASSEMSHWRDYEHIVINRDLEAAIAQTRAVLEAARSHRDRLTGLSSFVERLTKD